VRRVAKLPAQAVTYFGYRRDLGGGCGLENSDAWHAQVSVRTLELQATSKGDNAKEFKAAPVAEADGGRFSGLK